MALAPLLAVLGLSGAYYTCRHTYEPALIAELAAAGVADAVSPHPGLVFTPSDDAVRPGGSDDAVRPGGLLDPVYALQVLPDARIVRSESAAGLVRAALDVLSARGADESGGAWADCAGWDAAARGSLAVHVLVPDMFKGSPKPTMGARATRVGDAVQAGLRKRHRFARAAAADDAGEAAEGAPSPAGGERWLLQLLLLEADTLALSLCRCEGVGPVGGCWPNWRRPAGLAVEALAPSEQIGWMPSSAYRKLMEALDCMERAPEPHHTAVDLGASPGAWTCL